MSNQQKADGEEAAAPSASGSLDASGVERHALCRAYQWKHGSLDQAVRAGVRAGKLRELQLGCVAASSSVADSTPDESA